MAEVIVGEIGRAIGLRVPPLRAVTLDCAFAIDTERLTALAPHLDLASVDASLETVQAICRGEPAPGRPAPDGLGLDGLGPRSGWLAAPRSTVVQPGPVHGGLTSDPAAELQRLLARLVG